VGTSLFDIEEEKSGMECWNSMGLGVLKTLVAQENPTADVDTSSTKST